MHSPAPPAISRSLFFFAIFYGGMVCIAGVLGNKQVALGPLAVESGIFAFLFNWNDFFGPLIYLSDPAKHTLAIALQFYRTPTSTTGPVHTWSHLMAVSVVVMLPCLILFFVAQRTFIQGIVVTGVKG